jgi:hypothetical protein
VSQSEQLPQSSRVFPRVDEVAAHAPREPSADLTLEDLEFDAAILAIDLTRRGHDARVATRTTERHHGARRDRGA